MEQELKILANNNEKVLEKMKTKIVVLKLLSTKTI